MPDDQLNQPGPTPPPAPAVPPEPQAAPQTKKRGWLKWGIAVLVVIVLAGGAWGYMTWQKNKDTTAKQSTTTSKKVKLVYAVHWTEKPQLDALQKYLDQYTKLHSNVTFSVQVIPFAQYADKLKVLNDAGAAPDIFQIYSAWGVSYVRQNMLDTPPADVQTDVKQNYVSQAGVTIDGKIWGYPTEINDYALLYNKDLFKTADIVDAAGNAKPPQNWAEVITDAAKLTKKDSKGTITQYGMSFLKDNDWEVVDPFLSLLFSNGGQYLSSDLKHSLFNSPAGVGALNAELSLFKNGSTDLNGNFYDFGKGTVGMVISPPWAKGGFAKDFGSKFSTSVGVAPFPKLVNQDSLQYSWFMGVMSESAHKQAAWDFLRWFQGDVQPTTGTTRYGDLLADPIGAIPSRKVDNSKHASVLGDFFTKTFVDQLPNSQAEPNVLGSSDLKKLLMDQIQAAWAGQKTSTQALNDAAAAIDKQLQN